MAWSKTLMLVEHLASVTGGLGVLLRLEHEQVVRRCLLDGNPIPLRTASPWPEGAGLSS
jgi:hypothetical protein